MRQTFVQPSAVVPSPSLYWRLLRRHPATFVPGDARLFEPVPFLPCACSLRKELGSSKRDLRFERSM